MARCHESGSGAWLDAHPVPVIALTPLAAARQQVPVYVLVIIPGTQDGANRRYGKAATRGWKPRLRRERPTVAGGFQPPGCAVASDRRRMWPRAVGNRTYGRASNRRDAPSRRRLSGIGGHVRLETAPTAGASDRSRRFPTAGMRRRQRSSADAATCGCKPHLREGVQPPGCAVSQTIVGDRRPRAVGNRTYQD